MCHSKEKYQCPPPSHVKPTHQIIVTRKKHVLKIHILVINILVISVQSLVGGRIDHLLDFSFG